MRDWLFKGRALLSHGTLMLYRVEGQRVPATVLFPTPPLADETAMTLSTPAILRLWGRFAHVGGVPERGRP